MKKELHRLYVMHLPAGGQFLIILVTFGVIAKLTIFHSSGRRRTVSPYWTEVDAARRAGLFL